MGAFLVGQRFDHDGQALQVWSIKVCSQVAYPGGGYVSQSESWNALELVDRPDTSCVTVLSRS